LTRREARCAAIARAAGEPLAGTASHARGCVLISYPKRMWAPNALASEGLPKSLLDAVDQLGRDHDVVTRLVAHEGTWDERVEVSLYPQARRHHEVPLADVARVLTESDPDDGETITKPVIACCTHGVRDRCCALYGMALVSALRAATGADGVEIREASHLGGDRFAPTVLVLPSGHMYGHLDPSDADALIDAVRGAATLRRCFRGSLWLDPLEQLAEVAALDALASGPRMPTLGPITTTEHDPDHATLRCTASSETNAITLSIECVREHRLVIGDCRNADANRRGSVRVWRIEKVSTS
jgi:hypothetical protein